MVKEHNKSPKQFGYVKINEIYVSSYTCTYIKNCHCSQKWRLGRGLCFLSYILLKFIVEHAGGGERRAEAPQWPKFMHCNALRGSGVHSECSPKMTQANDKHSSLPKPLPSCCHGAIVDYLCVIGYLSQSFSWGQEQVLTLFRQEYVCCFYLDVVSFVFLMPTSYKADIQGNYSIHIENGFDSLWIMGITLAWSSCGSESCSVIAIEAAENRFSPLI